MTPEAKEVKAGPPWWAWPLLIPFILVFLVLAPELGVIAAMEAADKRKKGPQP